MASISCSDQKSVRLGRPCCETATHVGLQLFRKEKSNVSRAMCQPQNAQLCNTVVGAIVKPSEAENENELVWPILEQLFI